MMDQANKIRTSIDGDPFSKETTQTPQIINITKTESASNARYKIKLQAAPKDVKHPFTPVRQRKKVGAVSPDRTQKNTLSASKPLL
jgi:hypothetical protein